MTGPGDPTASTSKQIRGSALLLAGQAFAAVANLVAQVLIVRYLTQESYGAFAYALSIALTAEAFARFGMRRGVARYIPLYEEKDDPARAAGTLALAMTTVLAVGIIVVLLVVGLRGALTSDFDPDSAAIAVLVLLAFMAPIEALGSLLDAVFAVFERPRTVVARRFVLTPLFRLAVIGLLIAEGLDVTFLAAGYVATGLVGLALYGPLLVRTLRERGLLERLRPSRVAVPAREVLGFTFPLLTSDVTAAVLTSASGIALGLLATPTAVADLRAVLPLALTMGYVLTSFGLLLVPLASRLYARGEATELSELYWTTAIWTAVLAYPIFLVCVALPEPTTVLLFGERYEGAASVLAILAVGQFVNTAAGNNGVMLGVFKKVRFIVVTNLAAIAAIVLMLLVLVPPFEAEGAAIATSASLVLLNAVRQLGLTRTTSIRGIPAPAARVYGVMLGLAALAIGLDALVSPPTAIEVAAVIGSTAIVMAVARRGMAIAENFPELARVPVLRRLVGARPAA